MDYRFLEVAYMAFCYLMANKCFIGWLYLLFKIMSITLSTISIRLCKSKGSLVR